nr:MAG TPA: hypothetical protein [Caudoviricetes sp.]
MEFSSLQNQKMPLKRQGRRGSRKIRTVHTQTI